MKAKMMVVAAGLLGASVLQAPAANAYQFGNEPANDAYAVAASVGSTCGLPANDLAAMGMAASVMETVGGATNLTPSPMTLSRYDNQAALYAFGNSATPYRNAFFHPGIGLYQLDSAGLGSGVGAHQAIDSSESARVTLTSMSQRFCNAGGTNAQRRAAAWGPWVACNAGKCESAFQSIVANGVARDGGVGRLGGMERQLCSRGGQTFDCWFVDPAKAQGHASWRAAGFGPSPVSAPFYTFVSAAGEERHWLPQHTGYNTAISAVRPLGVNARNGLRWSASSDINPLGSNRPPVRLDVSGDRVADANVLYDFGDFVTSDGFVRSGAGASFKRFFSGGAGYTAANARPVGGDFTGDGVSDLGIVYRHNAPTGAFITLDVVARQGADAGTFQRVWQGGAGYSDLARMKIVGGDFNGDRLADVGIVYNHGSFVTFDVVSRDAGSAAMSFKRVWQGGTDYSFSRIKAAAADINADGRSDLTMLFNHDTFVTADAVIVNATGTAGTWQRMWQGGAGYLWDKADLVGGDFTGDGRGDFGIIHDAGEQIAVDIARTNTDGTTATWNRHWIGGAGYLAKNLRTPAGVPTTFAGDLNGDGVTDIGLFYNHGTVVTFDAVVLNAPTPFQRYYTTGADYAHSRIAVAR